MLMFDMMANQHLAETLCRQKLNTTYYWVMPNIGWHTCKLVLIWLLLLLLLLPLLFMHEALAWQSTLD